MHKNIEVDIIQSVGELSVMLRSSLAETADSSGLSLTQANIVLHIGAGITMVSGIARKMGVTDATISDSVKSLKLKGVVSAVENTRDTRSKILSLTEKGRELAKLLAGHDEICRQKISGMYLSEKAVLLESLQNLLKRLS